MYVCVSSDMFRLVQDRVLREGERVATVVVVLQITNYIVGIPNDVCICICFVHQNLQLG